MHQPEQLNMEKLEQLDQLLTEQENKLEAIEQDFEQQFDQMKKLAALISGKHIQKSSHHHFDRG